MRCDLSPVGLGCVFCIGLMVGSLAAIGVANTDAVPLVILLTLLIWLLWFDATRPQSGRWERIQGRFWWHRAPDDPTD